MADRKYSSNQKNFKNPLLFGAGSSLTFDELVQGVQLVPDQKSQPSLQPRDVDEVDSFLGADTPSVTPGLTASGAVTPPRQTSPSCVPSRPSPVPSRTENNTVYPPPPSDSLPRLFSPPYSAFNLKSDPQSLSAHPPESGSFSQHFTPPVTDGIPPSLNSFLGSQREFSPAVLGPPPTSAETVKSPSPSTDQLKQIPLGDSVPLYDPSTLQFGQLAVCPPLPQSTNQFGQNLSTPYPPDTSLAPCLPPPPPTSTNHSVAGDSDAFNVRPTTLATHPVAAPPKGIGGAVSYRLGNLKRPTYARPPELSMATNKMPVMGTNGGGSQPVRHPLPPVQEQASSLGEDPAPPVTQVQASHFQPPQLFIPQLERNMSISVEATPPPSAAFPATVPGMTYRPVYHHWFYRRGGTTDTFWEPFSMADSLNLEQALISGDLNDETLVATDGGRYDVEITNRKKVAAFWEEPPSEVRRCSWFVRTSGNSRYIPYDENIAALLEDEYKQASLRNDWNRRVELSDGEVIILHGPSSIAHHQRSSSPDPWGNPPAMQYKPRVVKRGLDEFDIPEGEPSQVDHLLLVVHGIGKVCDLRFRSLVEVVDDFRAVSLQLVQSHFKAGCERGAVGRVEMLPVEWHRALHTEAIDQRLIDITLPSIPKAREFTNETLLDILFYTSPVFCEKIVQAVGAELNRVYSLYLERNPGFKGQVSLGGHSLGSLILFDMLCHQRPSKHHQHLLQQTSIDDQVGDEIPEQGHLGCLKTKAKLSRRMSYLTIGTGGTGQPYIIYPQLLFQPRAFFALGSPIGMFVTVRGIESLGEDFKFPTCPSFFNIFHPYDPVAYRVEALISSEMAKVPAVLIPHHKGRKRMHLELKDTMAHVTAALKQKLLDSFKNTWNTVYQMAMFHRPDHSIEKEVEKVIEDEMMVKEGERSGSIGCSSSASSGGDESAGLDLKVGSLNGGRRIDYVLQEAPLETFNQYISAVRSHVVYWESEDTMLMILKEIYQTMGISTDSQVSQPILPFDISSDDYADPGKAYTHYTESTTLSPLEEYSPGN